MENLFSGIDTIILRVTSIETASAWYHEKLGFKPTWQDDNLKLVVLDTGGPTSITLWQSAEKITAHPEATPYPIFGIKDARSGREVLIARGVRVGELTSDHVTTYFRFFDADGNMLEACQVH